MSDCLSKDTHEDVDYIKIGNTTYEVYSIYDGEISLIDLIKNSLKQDAQAVLRRVYKQ